MLLKYSPLEQELYCEWRILPITYKKTHSILNITVVRTCMNEEMGKALEYALVRRESHSWKYQEWQCIVAAGSKFECHRHKLDLLLGIERFRVCVVKWWQTSSSASALCQKREYKSLLQSYIYKNRWGLLRGRHCLMLHNKFI